MNAPLPEFAGQNDWPILSLYPRQALLVALGMGPISMDFVNEAAHELAMESYTYVLEQSGPHHFIYFYCVFVMFFLRIFILFVYFFCGYLFKISNPEIMLLWLILLDWAMYGRKCSFIRICTLNVGCSKSGKSHALYQSGPNLSLPRTLFSEQWSRAQHIVLDFFYLNYSKHCLFPLFEQTNPEIDSPIVSKSRNLFTLLEARHMRDACVCACGRISLRLRIVWLIVRLAVVWYWSCACALRACTRTLNGFFV